MSKVTSADDLKLGDLCKAFTADYGWIADDMDAAGKQQYKKFVPLVDRFAVKKGMIVEVVAILNFLHVAVWVPELNGYTIFIHGDLDKISK